MKRILQIFQKFRNLFNQRVRYKLNKIILYGVPTYDLKQGGMIDVCGNSPAYGALTTDRGEVIEPFPYETAEDIASFISQRAVDREYVRIIVYPIEQNMKDEVLNLIDMDHETYPLLDYFPAMMVGTNGDVLNSKSIIYKYKKLHDAKPI